MAEPTGGVWELVHHKESGLYWVSLGPAESSILVGPLWNEADARLMAASKRILTELVRIREDYRFENPLRRLGVRWLDSVIAGATGNNGLDPEATLSDAQRLAYAVLDGDEETALLLADEVQMAAREGATFVSREELLARIRLLGDQLSRTTRSQVMGFPLDGVPAMPPGWTASVPPNPHDPTHLDQLRKDLEERNRLTYLEMGRQAGIPEDAIRPQNTIGNEDRS